MGLYRPTYADKKTGEIKTARTWWHVRVENGKKIRTNLHVTQRRAAERKVSALIESIENGTEHFDATKRSDPDTLVTEYGAEQVRRGRSRKHVDQSLKRIRRLLNGVFRLEDMTPERIRLALARATEEGSAERENFDGNLPEGPLSAKTANDYRVCLSGFFSWLVKEGRWPHNPVAQVQRAKVLGRTRERRSLTLPQLKQLLETAPRERAIVYWLAATTGLRRNELKLLRWSDVNAEACVIRVRAENAKNRREEMQPAPADCLAALLGLREKEKRDKHTGQTQTVRALTSEPVFDSLPLTRTFYKDLSEAKITPGKDGKIDGEVLDFHALRVTYCTLLARAGVPLVQAQKLMRHSDPKLTANVYSRLGLVDGHAAVARLHLETGELAQRLRIEKGNAEATASDLVRLGPKLGPASESLGVLTGLTRTNAETENDETPRGISSQGLDLIESARLGFEPRLAGSEPAEPPSRGNELQRRLGPQLGPNTGPLPESSRLARDLMRAAATASDPRPLLDAARALLLQAERERVHAEAAKRDRLAGGSA